MDAYHAHGESEQYHSELKTDMDVERLPSGKFETNELVLELALISYSNRQVIVCRIDTLVISVIMGK